MRREPTNSYVQSADDAVDRGCDHCNWYTVADSYPVLVKRYQDHLREDHPRAWMRS